MGCKEGNRRIESMIIDSELKWQLHEMVILSSDIVSRMKSSDLLYNTYLQVDRLRELYTDAIIAGWTEFDCEKAKELGWLSERDEEWFKEKINETYRIG